MARNFGGLGLSFEVEDDGAVKKTEDFSSSIESLWTNVQKAGSAAMSAGRTIGTGLGKIGRVGTRGVGGVTSAIDSMVQSAMSPQLSSAYESMYAGFNKTFSAMTSGMNMSSKEAKKMRGIIGGAAFGLNEDMGETAKTWAFFRKQNIDLNKTLGAGGTKDAIQKLIKITSVYGVEGEQLGIVLAGLQKGFNFTAEQSGELADKVFYTAKQFNVGREAIQAWPRIFESLNKLGADFGKNFSREEMEKYTLSITAMGGGLSQALGVPAQSAMEIVTNMTETLMSERKNIINMFRGTSGEFGELAQRLTETGGNVDDVFKMVMEGDPLKMMELFRNMAQQAEKQGGRMGIQYQRFMEILGRTVDPSVLYAAQGAWDDVRGSIEKVPELMKSGEWKGAFAKGAEAAHKTGLTTQERWDRMIENMRMKLFELSGQNIKEWMGDMKVGFQKTMKTLSGLASEEGPIGEITKRILAVQRVGLSALIPGLESAAPLFSSLATSMLPVMTAMGSMGLSFGGLGKMLLPGGIFFAGLQILKYGPEEAVNKAIGFFKKLGEHFGIESKDIKKKIGSWVSALKGIDWDDVFEKIIGTGRLAGRYLGEFLGKAARMVDWGKVMKGIANMAISAIGGLGSILSDIFIAMFAGGEKDMSKGISNMEEPLKAGFSTALGNAVWWAATSVKDIVIGAGKTFWSYMFSSESIGDAFDKLVGLMTAGFAGMLVLSKGFRSKMISGSKFMFRSMGISYKFGWRGIMKTTKLAMKGIGRTVRAGAKFIPGATLFFGLFEALDQIGIRSKNISEIMSSNIIDASSKASLAGEEIFAGTLSTIDAMLAGLPSMLGEAFGLTSDTVSSIFQHMVGDTENAIDLIMNRVELWTDQLVNAFGTIYDAGKHVFDAFIAGLGLAKNTAFVIFDKIKYFISDTWQSISRTIGDFLEDIKIDLMQWGVKVVGVLPESWAKKIGVDVEEWRKELEQAETKRDEKRRQRELEDNEEARNRLARREALATEREVLERKIDDSLGKAADTAKAGMHENKRLVDDADRKQLQFMNETQRLVDKSISESGKERRRRGKDSTPWREGQTDAIGEKEEKGTAKRRPAKTTAPTIEERADRVSREFEEPLKEMAYQQAHLHEAMSGFFKKPLDVQVKIVGDVKRFLKAAEAENRNLSNAKVM